MGRTLSGSKNDQRQVTPTQNRFHPRDTLFRCSPHPVMKALVHFAEGILHTQAHCGTKYMDSVPAALPRGARTRAAWICPCS